MKKREIRRRLMALGFRCVRRSKHEIWKNPSTGEMIVAPRPNKNDAAHTVATRIKQLERAEDA